MHGFLKIKFTAGNLRTAFITWLLDMIANLKGSAELAAKNDQLTQFLLLYCK